MGSYRSSCSVTIAMVVLLLFTIFALSSALDMSIVSNNDGYGEKSTGRTDGELRAMYEAWLVKHGKAYNGLGEKEKRFGIFTDNLRFIDEHNAQNLSFKLGLNRFADLTNEEYRSKYLGTKISGKKRISERYAPRIGDDLPESVDWRKKGAVVGVKDQGSCGELTVLFICFFLTLSLLLFLKKLWCGIL
uniref:Cathepsin propeptide inhibitor domain-containing protein n=1 Tax=Cannabis sativa TaxID=3483 RepID=A0ABL6UDG8_CANSA